MIEKVTAVAGDVVTGLKEQPHMLAMVVLNVLFLLVVVFMLMKISDATAGRDALIKQIAEQCFKRE